MAVLWDLRDCYQLTLEWTRGAISRVKYREYDQIIFVPNCNNTHTNYTNPTITTTLLP